MRILKKHGEKLLKKELKASYKFFMREVNLKNKGYGLIKDKDM